MSTRYLKWKIELKDDNKSYAGDKILAEKLSRRGYKAIIENYVYIYPEEIQKTFELMPKAWESFRGKGIDLGSGVGCVSSVIAQKEEVKKIYSLDIIEEVVRLCQPIVIRKILKKEARKVVSVLGDFNNLKIKDNTLNFAVSWFSMHHSDNLVKTLMECRRVLKPGGRCVIVDRAHNNAIPDSEIERMRNIVYNKEWLKRNYWPLETVMTRKEYGEQEWRFFEWEKFIKQASFKILTEIVLKTDTDENRRLKNDNNLCEVMTNYNLGVFGNKAIGFVLAK